VNSTAKGNKAELDAWEWIESGHWPFGDGWTVGTRRKGRREKGPGDHLVCKFGERTWVVEVKGGKQLWRDFPRDERAALLEFAKRRSFLVAVVWRPAPSKPFQFIEAADWP
jgi:hypothetical protein